MSRLFLCLGKYAQNPYWLDRSELNIYSIEELCFYIRENVIILDRDFMKSELAVWVQEECGLEALSKKMLSCLHQKESLLEFVRIILKETGYYGKEEQDIIYGELQENAKMNGMEKRKSRVDFYLKSGKYSIALKEYELLRRDLENTEPELSGKISNNMGTIYARLYAYELAAENFLKAYESDPQESYYFSYLAAKRMALPEKEYVDFIAGQSAHYNISLELEKTLEELNREWEESDDCHMLLELKEWHRGSRAAEYYETIEQLSEQWKETYRQNVINHR